MPGNGWDRSAKTKLSGEATGGRLTLSGAGQQLVVADLFAVQLDSAGRETGRLVKMARSSPTMGLAPPPNAVVLFDGRSTDQFLPGAKVTPDGHGEVFLRQKMASQTKSQTLDAIDPRALEHYLAPFRDPSRVHAMCEDYRAGAYADYEIDKGDFEAGNKITIPMLALWGDAGIASAAATPLDTWKKWATNVSGAPVDSGHFLTEENPEATGKLLREFFAAG